MDTDLTAYAAALLVGTGTSVEEITASLHTNTPAPSPAAAAVMDGWHSANESGATT